MKQKMNLKSGMFNGLPAYACALLLLAAGLVLSVLYAVTVGSAELSVGEVYRVILYELFRWGDPEQLGSGAVHDIVHFCYNTILSTASFSSSAASLMLF